MVNTNTRKTTVQPAKAGVSILLQKEALSFYFLVSSLPQAKEDGGGGGERERELAEARAIEATLFPKVMNEEGGCATGAAAVRYAVYSLSLSRSPTKIERQRNTFCVSGGWTTDPVRPLILALLSLADSLRVSNSRAPADWSGNLPDRGHIAHISPTDMRVGGVVLRCAVAPSTLCCCRICTHSARLAPDAAREAQLQRDRQRVRGNQSCWGSRTTGIDGIPQGNPQPR